MKKRMSPETFCLPVDEIRQGLYSDAYFLRTAEILNRDQHHPTVLMQVFQRKDAVLCGIDEAIAVLKTCAFHPEKLKIHALFDGDEVKPWETVMTIEGDLADFSHLETVYLGSLARQTKIATNVRNAVQAAKGKPVLFFSARYDHYAVQRQDGYAAKIGGISGVSTDANGAWWSGIGMGTIPHALIASYHGNTVDATNAFDRHIDPAMNRVALVDFDNDCVNTSLAVARTLGDKLWAVRLDTSNNVVDQSLQPRMGMFPPTGVCQELVKAVREGLDAEGFPHVKIMVSGGFNPEKITAFEKNHIPVDIYAVGSSFMTGSFDFTADIVQVNHQACSKFGRVYCPNDRLSLVE